MQLSFDMNWAERVVIVFRKTQLSISQQIISSLLIITKCNGDTMKKQYNPKERRKLEESKPKFSKKSFIEKILSEKGSAATGLKCSQFCCKKKSDFEEDMKELNCNKNNKIFYLFSLTISSDHRRYNFRNLKGGEAETNENLGFLEYSFQKRFSAN